MIKMATRYFRVESVAYPLGVTAKFIRNEINFYIRRGINPKLAMCEVGSEPIELTKKEFMEQVREYEQR